MSYRESDFQSEFTKWLRTKAEELGMGYTFGYDLKITKTNSMPFTAVKPHQITSLKKTKHGCIRHKISDQAVGFKPFDGMQICNSPAYLIILYYKKGDRKVMYFVDIDDYISFVGDKSRGGLPEETAKTMAKHIFIL